MIKKIVHMRDIDEQATLDGGDCMLVGDHLYVGLSARTNARGAAVLEKVSQRYQEDCGNVKQILIRYTF